jgi:hypothetical protein
MKATLLIGALALVALALPLVTAHVVVTADLDGDGVCEFYAVGSPRLAPHASAWVAPCGPIFHTGGTLP